MPFEEPIKYHVLRAADTGKREICPPRITQCSELRHGPSFMYSSPSKFSHCFTHAPWEQALQDAF